MSDGLRKARTNDPGKNLGNHIACWYSNASVFFLIRHVTLQTQLQALQFKTRWFKTGGSKQRVVQRVQNLCDGGSLALLVSSAMTLIHSLDCSISIDNSFPQRHTRTTDRVHWAHTHKGRNCSPENNKRAGSIREVLLTGAPWSIHQSLHFTLEVLSEDQYNQLRLLCVISSDGWLIRKLSNKRPPGSSCSSYTPCFPFCLRTIPHLSWKAHSVT